jgi:hypothetical protein
VKTTGRWIAGRIIIQIDSGEGQRKGILETTGEEDASDPFRWQRGWTRSASGDNNDGTEKEGDDYGVTSFR